MLTTTEPKVNQSNAFKLYRPQKSWRTVRRRSVVICVACKGVAVIVRVNFSPDQA